MLDEADVFMEARNATDLGRNELVSIFLRMLEYYEVSSYEKHNPRLATPITHYLGIPLPYEQPRGEY